MPGYQTFAIRFYAVLMTGFAAASLGGALLFWYWSGHGVPDAVTSTLQMSEVTERMLRGLGFFAGVLACIAGLNFTFAALLLKNYRWPAVLTTLGWAIVLWPLVRDTHSLSLAIVMALLFGLTATMLWPRAAA